MKYTKKTCDSEDESINVDTTIKEEINKSKSQKSLEQLKFGDIVIANRYKNNQEKERIPVGHRVGPAIILFNENNKLYCVMGTGVEPESFVSENGIFCIQPGNYNLTKNTFFSMNSIREIKYEDIDEVLGEMNSEDIKMFTKKYIIMKNRGVYKNIKSLNFNISLEIGDIFKYNQEYFLIIDVNKKNYTCFKLNAITDIKNENSILIDKKYYDINYRDPVSISKNINSVIISTLKSKQIISILKRYEEYVRNQNNQKIVQRGSLIKLEGNLYFIYGENGNKWLIFKVFDNKKKGSKIIRINNEYYYTKFNGLNEISKNSDFEVLCLATQDEIDVISSKKKGYIEQKKVVDKKAMRKGVKFNYPNFLPGEVVKTKTMCDDKYIIITRHTKYVYCISIDNIKNGNFRLEYFDIKLLVSIGKISNKFYDIVDGNSIELKEDIKKLELKF